MDSDKQAGAGTASPRRGLLAGSERERMKTFLYVFWFALLAIAMSAGGWLPFEPWHHWGDGWPPGYTPLCEKGGGRHSYRDETGWQYERDVFRFERIARLRAWNWYKHKHPNLEPPREWEECK